MKKANLPRKIRLHSFWLLCLPSFNSEQARKGTVPRRFNNGMHRGMVSAFETGRLVSRVEENRTQAVGSLEGDICLLENHLYCWGDAMPAPNFPFSASGSDEDLRIFASPVESMSNMEWHLKGIAPKRPKISGRMNVLWHCMGLSWVAYEESSFDLSLYLAVEKKNLSASCCSVGRH